jgi:hypothetical protein
MSSPIFPFHTSTPKDSGARPKTFVQGAHVQSIDENSMNPDFVALQREPNSVDERELDREIQELTACYERVKSAYEKRKSVSQNKNARLGEQASVDNSTRVEKQVTFKNLAQSSPVNLNTSSQCKESEIEAVQRRIRDLERQELELSIALQRSQLDAYKSATNSPTRIDTPQTSRTVPTQLETLHPYSPEMSNQFTSVDTPRVIRSNYSHPVRKEKEPDKFDGRSVEWKDFIVHFEQVSSWNKWSYHEQGQQLIMCLRGEAQKLLGDLSVEQRSDYVSLKSILTKRFNPQELVIAHRCEFRSRRRKFGESPSDFGYSLRRLGCLAFPDMTYKDREINVLEQFINGIGNSAIHDHVIFHHPQSLEAAISLATEFEAVKGTQVNVSKPVRVEGVNTVQSKSDNGSQNQADSLQYKHQQDSPLESKNLNELFKTLESCIAKLSKSINRTNRGGKRNSGNMSYIECYNCHKFGHIAKDCPHPNPKFPKPANTDTEGNQENI